MRRFRQIYRLEIEDTIIGTEPFPGEMLFPRKINVNLPDEIYSILVDYYNDAYNLKFLSITELAQKTMKTTERSISRFIVRPQINQYGRIRIRAELFRSANTSQYLKNSFIIAKFVQDNNSVE